MLVHHHVGPLPPLALLPQSENKVILMGMQAFVENLLPQRRL